LPIVTSRACANVQKGVELVQALMDEHKDCLQQNVVEVIHILQDGSLWGKMLENIQRIYAQTSARNVRMNRNAADGSRLYVRGPLRADGF